MPIRYACGHDAVGNMIDPHQCAIDALFPCSRCNQNLNAVDADYAPSQPPPVPQSDPDLPIGVVEPVEFLPLVVVAEHRDLWPELQSYPQPCHTADSADHEAFDPFTSNAAAGGSIFFPDSAWHVQGPMNYGLQADLPSFVLTSAEPGGVSASEDFSREHTSVSTEPTFIQSSCPSVSRHSSITLSDGEACVVIGDQLPTIAEEGPVANIPPVDDCHRDEPGSPVFSARGTPTSPTESLFGDGDMANSDDDGMADAQSVSGGHARSTLDSTATDEEMEIVPVALKLALPGTGEAWVHPSDVLARLQPAAALLANEDVDMEADTSLDPIDPMEFRIDVDETFLAADAASPWQFSGDSDSDTSMIEVDIPAWPSAVEVEDIEQEEIDLNGYDADMSSSPIASAFPSSDDYLPSSQGSSDGYDTDTSSPVPFAVPSSSDYLAGPQFSDVPSNTLHSSDDELYSSQTMSDNTASTKRTLRSSQSSTDTSTLSDDTPPPSQDGSGGNAGAQGGLPDDEDEDTEGEDDGYRSLPSYDDSFGSEDAEGEADSAVDEADAESFIPISTFAPVQVDAGLPLVEHYPEEQHYAHTESIPIPGLVIREPTAELADHDAIKIAEAEDLRVRCEAGRCEEDNRHLYSIPFPADENVFDKPTTPVRRPADSNSATTLSSPITSPREPLPAKSLQGLSPAKSPRKSSRSRSQRRSTQVPRSPLLPTQDCASHPARFQSDGSLEDDGLLSPSKRRPRTRRSRENLRV